MHVCIANCRQSRPLRQVDPLQLGQHPRPRRGRHRLAVDAFDQCEVAAGEGVVVIHAATVPQRVAGVLAHLWRERAETKSPARGRAHCAMQGSLTPSVSGSGRDRRDLAAVAFDALIR